VKYIYTNFSLFFSPFQLTGKNWPRVKLLGWDWEETCDSPDDWLRTKLCDSVDDWQRAKLLVNGLVESYVN
jgi:hypothetical protein